MKAMSAPHRPRRRAAAVIGACLAVSAVGGGVAAAPAEAGGRDGHRGGAPAPRSGPTVTHTGEAPTGYEVTFRYYAPDADRVQIKGEWSVERPSELPQLASTPGQTVETPGLLPTDWQPGDVPIQSPNSTDPNFPVSEMTEVGHSGVWTYTTPLPSGVFSYGFFPDCAAADQTGCTEQPDPGNPAWNVEDGVADGSAVATSQVYVPSDAEFGTVDYSWQGPAEEQGRLEHLTYSSPGHITPADENELVVYTPPGYDPDRAEAYPTLYLSHGGGEDEMGWSTQGDLGNIMDNLVATGQIQPMVVVMPNGTGYPDSVDNEAYRTDLVTGIIPWVESHYDVSTAAADRAFSGLSFGGQVTNQLMLNNTDAFGYYGMMSAGLAPGTELTPEQVAAIGQTQVFVGAGWQDVIFADGFGIGGVTFHTGPAQEVTTLTDAGIHVTTDFVNGGHEWYVWRILLRDFLTRVAFFPAPEATW